MNFTDMKQTEENIKKQLQFEKLISRISSKFINLPHDQVDNEIEDGLKLVAEAFGIDRSLLHQFSEDRQHFRLTHFFVRPGVEVPTSIITSSDQPYFTKTILNKEIIRMERIDNIPEKAKLERKYLMQQGVKSGLAIPLVVGDKPVGALTFTTAFRERSWPDEEVQRLKLISEVFANALDRKQKEQSLQTALLNIKQLKDQLQQENIYLREEIEVKYRHGEIVGNTDAIKKVLSQVEQVAPTDSNVLILGETGTGKELLARAIHNLSSRKKRTMVTVNCTALPAALIESELFGREKGAYTGALSRQIGRFEAANGSTIFLDEIGELPPEMQVKLLRVLQDGKFERLGSTEPVTVDARIIAATNQDLGKAVKTGKFRRDLYYRLNVFPITVPLLRDRREDIPLLVWTFVKEYEKAMGKRIESITDQTMDLLYSYSWPGNVRELKNVIERAMILTTSSVLRIRSIGSKETIEHGVTLEDAMRGHILKVLENTGWRVSGKNGAAELLGLKESTLRARMKKIGIKKKK